MLMTTPAVFAVKDTYKIAVPVNEKSIISVKIGDEEYFDEMNGVLRSEPKVHIISVPMHKLDKEKKYTVVDREVIKRKPYFSETREPVKTVYNFRPVKDGENFRFFLMSDVHNMVNEAAAAKETYGDIDLLIMAGDIMENNGTEDNILMPYRVAEKVTGGEIPIVYARGNHDLRGPFAEKYTEYLPSNNGKLYYTFNINGIWGIIIDCGEDKVDSHEEYGNTIACSVHRKNVTKFLLDVVNNADNEYNNESVKLKLVISHIPFTYIQPPPFDIETDTYRSWAKIIKDNIEPDLMLCGHTHEIRVSMPGSDFDMVGQPCPLIIGGIKGENYNSGAGIKVSKDNFIVEFCDSVGKKIMTKEIKRG